MIEAGVTTSHSELTPGSDFDVASGTDELRSGFALDTALLAATPCLNQYFDEMCESIADRRVIIVRRGGTIALGTLFAILGALLIHALLAVVVFLLWKVIIASPWNWTQGHWSPVADNGGRPGTSFTMLGEGPYTGTDANPYLGPIAPDGTNATPTASDVQYAPADDPWHAAVSAQTPDDPPLIGVPNAITPSVPSAFPAAAGPVIQRPTALPLLPGPVVVGPNSPTLQVPGAHGTEGTAATSGTASIAKVGPHPGGDSDDGDDQPTISIMRGRDGAGGGTGSESGEGIDRGGSGANNETPGIIYNPQPDLPLAMAVKPVSGKVVFAVMVLADGTAGEIKLMQSCGDSTVDAACKSVLARWKFRPAYRDAKPFATATEIGFTFGHQDN